MPFESADDDGLDVLTPGHFLVGRLLETLPDRRDVQVQHSTLKRWNLCQLMVRKFWHRWSTEYIRILNKTNKWKRDQENIPVGDIRQQSVYFYHLPVITFATFRLIKFKTLSTFDCLGCCLTSLLDLANSGTLAQEETFPVRCSVLSKASCIAH